MKKLVVVAAMLFIGAALKAQMPYDSAKGKVVYTEVVQVDGALTKDVIYTGIRAWFAQKYNSASHVLKMDDKETGTLVCKAIDKVTPKLSLGASVDFTVSYTLTIMIKDGRYKYEIQEFYVDNKNRIEEYLNPVNKRAAKLLNQIVEQTDNDMRALISSLKKSVNTTSDSNW
jgi:hypothetical protein